MKPTKFHTTTGSLALAGLLLGVPSLGAATLPCGIILDAMRSGVPDPAGTITIGGLVFGDVVTIRFGGCVGSLGQPDFRICDVQPSGATVACPTQPGDVTVVSPGASVTFTIVGGGVTIASQAPYGLRPPNNTGACLTNPQAGCATVIVNGGKPVGTVSVATFDLNGVGGVNAADLSILVGDVFSLYAARSDYNFSGTVNPVDLSQWLTVTFAGNSLESCSDYCN